MTTYASAADQLAPAGFTQVWRKLYSTPAADKDVLVETVDFYTVTVLGTVIGSVSNMVSKLQSDAQAAGSDMYGLALYHRTVDSVNISIPDQICIGPACVDVPGGGTTLFATNEYRLVGVHSQFQFALLAIGLALAFGIVMFVITNLNNLQGVFSNIASDFAKAFGGGQTGAITSELIWFVLAGGVFSVGAYILLRDITQTSGLSASAVRVPGTPGIAPLQNPLQYAPSYGVSSPYGGIQESVRGVQVGVGPSGGRPRLQARPGGGRGVQTRTRRAA